MERIGASRLDWCSHSCRVDALEPDLWLTTPILNAPLIALPPPPQLCAESPVNLFARLSVLLNNGTHRRGWESHREVSLPLAACRSALIARPGPSRHRAPTDRLLQRP